MGRSMRYFPLQEIPISQLFCQSRLPAASPCFEMCLLHLDTATAISLDAPLSPLQGRHLWQAPVPQPRRLMAQTHSPASTVAGDLHLGYSSAR